MTKDEIQFWMLIAFAVVFLLSTYKIHIVFKAPSGGIDARTQYNQLETIMINFIKESSDLHINQTNFFNALMALPDIQKEEYKNFNRNRFNQLLEQLYLQYNVSNLDELIERLKSET